MFRPHGHRALAHTGLTSSMTGGVRIGSNAEELEIEIVEREEKMNKTTLRSHSRTANVTLLSTPVAPYTHLPLTTTTLTTSRTDTHTPAHQVCPSTLRAVDPFARSLSTQTRRISPRIWCSPATADPTHQPNPVPPPILAAKASRAATATARRGYERRADAGSTACVWVPPTCLSCHFLVPSFASPIPPRRAFFNHPESTVTHSAACGRHVCYRLL